MAFSSVATEIGLTSVFVCFGCSCGCSFCACRLAAPAKHRAATKTGKTFILRIVPPWPQLNLLSRNLRSQDSCESTVHPPPSPHETYLNAGEDKTFPTFL